MTLSREVEGLSPVKPGNRPYGAVPIPAGLKSREMRSGLYSLFFAEEAFIFLNAGHTEKAETGNQILETKLSKKIFIVIGLVSDF